MLKLAVIGAGAWGRNLIRNFHQLPDVELAWCCDSDPKACEAISQAYPGVQTTNSARYSQAMRQNRNPGNERFPGSIIGTLKGSKYDQRI